MAKISVYPKSKGLYDFSREHDSCGVGFVANIDGHSSHEIIEKGIQVLIRLQHRGAVGGDANTGDGAGLLFQLPDTFFRKETEKLNFSLPAAGNYGVGMIFLSKDTAIAGASVQIISSKIQAENFELLGWRNVPTDNSDLGEFAKSTEPVIKQFFVVPKNKNLTGDNLERKLYILRRVVENEINRNTKFEDSFYIPSLSSKTIVYKGLLLAEQVRNYYRDLQKPDFKSAVALVHQRYSTNTFPTWPLAQPFRYLAHNGEINTLGGNINRMKAREQSFESVLFGDEIKKLLPVIQKNQSDSACLDNAMELLTTAGRSIPHSMMMLIPQAWGEEFNMGHDLKGFYDYHSGLMEPWDGPAALAFSNGDSVGAMLDRNGLRPARYTITKDDFIVLASESGVLEIPPEKIKAKGHLNPGDMIFVDFIQKRIMFDREIKNKVARWKPYRRWVQENRITLHGFFDSVVPPEINKVSLLKKQKLFGYTREEIRMIIKPMAERGVEATGSMGNDESLAVLSDKPQLLYNYFKQLFAQVTNPPIDPIREESVMTLMTYIGNRSNILSETPQHAHLLKMNHPVLTDEDLQRIRHANLSSFKKQTIKIQFKYDNSKKCRGLNEAIESIVKKAENSVRTGIAVIILSDRKIDEGFIPVPALLAVSAVNQHLIKVGLRTSTGIIAETGEAREIMHFALLFGYGATAVNPYIAIKTAVDQVNSGLLKITPTLALENYIKAVCKGLLKVMSKMGISTLRSYRGAQVFEAIGLDSNTVDKYFSGTASRIGGLNLSGIAKEAYNRFQNSSVPVLDNLNLLEAGGKYHYRKNAENHLWTPQTIADFHRAVRTNSKEHYRKYSNYINKQEEHLCTLRGLFTFKKGSPVPLENVEPASEIAKRFVTGAMSFGSISKEAHQSIAIAMNRIGGMSNSGEGGEDPVRYNPLPNGDSLCSAIKQVASGRFGVTAEYLANSKEIQIKIAQGAKPGEGGQLPGHKVNEIIAKVRHSTPGVTLISPPPHHDIYSIEDLAQLIFDLKNANPEARISVKLVSEVGVGTVAAGVSKGHADMVLISGHDGGTGASPLTSIKHTGLPWELGLAETQQTLVLNNLRSRIKVQCDGQMKTGRDIIIAALLGAEEYGFATTALVALGCCIMRKCHSNTCPVGIATQDPELRKRFTGKPEHLINFFMFVAEEVREYLAELGFTKLDDIIGRSDFLETNSSVDFWKTNNIDFSGIFAKSDTGDLPVKFEYPQDHGIKDAFDNTLIEDTAEAVDKKKNIRLKYPISNVMRTTGTMLSYSIVKKYGSNGLPDNTVIVNFDGSAGQSFGAFLASGVTFNLFGEANDYVGKGLSGGRIVVRPPKISTFKGYNHTIAGNVLLYGATTGEAYFNGRVGERFAIRNSGATAVAEAVGDHCCEYMTGGTVVVLGLTGGNFGAGMSGGFAFVYDEDGYFDQKCNLQLLDLESVKETEDIKQLKTIIHKHYIFTDSIKAKNILENWDEALPKFVKVFPMEYRKVLGRMMKEDEEVVREEIND
ncbi:MAG: glutamate synthase large subunit [Victivallales bacterium]|nr:glutamate synthase large subunit [Victivallales bacterium]